MTADPFLAAESITVRFGGLTAVNRVSVDVSLGEIVGVIGPNGAGKSTLFGAILGTLPLVEGRVEVSGRDVTKWPSYRRANAGLGRTFQKMEIFGSMTVRENFEFAAEAPAIGQRPWRLLSRNRYRSASAASAMLEELGLQEFANQAAASLPVGIRRLIEFGRSLCAGPSLLLLDEPSSGLDELETSRLAEQVTLAAADRGVGVLLVEHDMSLVLSICQRIYVLDFGKCIASGTPEEIQRSPVVQEAYLGGGDAA